MRAGKLNRIVDIEEPNDTVSGSGATEKGWKSFETGVWAYFTGISGGGEKYATGEFVSIGLFRVEMRAVDGITTAMRLVMGARTFDILDLDDLTDKFKLTMTVREGQSKGN